MMWGYGDWGWGAWLAMTASMLLFWGLLVGAIVWSVRTVTSGHQMGNVRDKPARDVLAERFVRGEIDEEEYRRRLSVLKEP